MTEHPLANHPPMPPRGVDLPVSDGEPMETERHRTQMNLLIDTLRQAWAHRDDFYAGGNMFVYFSQTQAKNNDVRGPDVFVVLDTTRRERESWVVWEEERSPDVVIELTSPSTEHVDRGRKKGIYARAMKVSAYFIYDPFAYTLDGFALDPTTLEYAPLVPDADGNLPCAPLGLRLGVRETDIGYEAPIPLLRWIGAGGAPLPTDAERAVRADRHVVEAETRAAHAETRAADAETKATRALALAEAERERAARLEARLAALEAKLSGDD